MDVRSKEGHPAGANAHDMSFKELNEKLKGTEFRITFVATGG